MLADGRLAPRIAGSYLGFAEALRAVADHHGWTHVVLVSDVATLHFCWFGATAIDAVFSSNANYSYSWLRLSSEPDDEQIEDTLRQIRSLTRGLDRAAHAHSQIPSAGLFAPPTC